jgi:hypothetical protein
MCVFDYKKYKELPAQRTTYLEVQVRATRDMLFLLYVISFL